MDDSIGPKTTTNKKKKRHRYDDAGGSTTPSHGLVSLPRIESKRSPFKGFLDISVTSNKLRQSLDSRKVPPQAAARNNLVGRDGDGQAEVKPRPKKEIREEAKKKEHPSKLSGKVLEAWINETLQDAEHLDIPGVVLKPENRTPI